MHVEVAPEQSVGEAHSLVTRFEERLKSAIPDLKRIVTHIEPAHTCEGILYHDEDAHLMAEQALRIARNLYPDNHWHDLDIRAESDGGFALSMHCHVEESMPLEDAHRLAETVETQVRAALPALHRVTIHTEPPST
jgi:divalent metal cation (Fe/Co/Zn/Cd) transporter